jgi:hypothetical protein
MRDYNTEIEIAEYAKTLADNAREQGRWQGLVAGCVLGALVSWGIITLAGVVLP